MWALDPSILLSICRVYIPGSLYVRLIMSSYVPVLLYLLQCLVDHMLSKMRSSGIYI